ncbi:putative ubiquitin receptor RAD23a [Auxenochlorella protothecoides]|uniref:Ubiquitin receptor RAD23 n=1 Tax=Auxenochlorella protothecoides TaxID=3075 RepID=A0A087SPP4_AUXPR|nr:putative ubiquitin receptor RAD23a [Auxenochlorella protothecoides]KFM27698.1 putative ubiquitin receptor RAD23a [Auxenochlorella protothecoides]
MKVTVRTVTGRTFQLDFAPETQILKDDATLTGSNVSESGFIVVMVIKEAASQLARGSELEAKVAAIVDMGFPREEVQRAMRAAFNNPERAVEYLMSGIPAGLGFQMLKAMVQQNPALLQPMLQELGRNNPALLEQINANQAAFLAMINEPSAAGGADLETLVQQLAGEYEGGEGGGEAMDEGDVPPGANVVEVHLSPEEVEAVERLVGLGFDRQVCLEAFLICDKNETLAANYLLENGQDA